MKKIFYGWWVVLATSLIHFWGAGTFYYGFTVFFNPIVNEFGWTYAATSFASSLRSIEGGIAAPLIGFAADRYGARRLLLVGSIFSGIGFICFSQINSLWSFYLVFFFLSIGSSFLLPVPGWTAVANWFERKRGTAMGLLSSAVGISGVLIYGINWLLEIYGWRSLLIIIGIGMWVIGIPSALIVRNSPETYSLPPGGDKPTGTFLDKPKDHAERETLHREGFSLSQALRTRAFWLVGLAVTISGSALHAVVVHIMPYFISVGFTREKASFVAALLVLVSIAGRLGLGWLSNRMNTRHLIAFGFLLQAFGLLFLARLETLREAILFIIFFGPGYGAVITLRLALQAEYFGRKAFGSIQGATFTIIVMGSMASPVLTGLVYDFHGSYRMAWLVLGALVLVGVLLALSARPPQKSRISAS